MLDPDHGDPELNDSPIPGGREVTVFTPTHEVPDGGTAAWSTPDPAAAPDSRLDAGLPVEVLEETTGWARIRCSNEWEAWVAAAALVPLVRPGVSPGVSTGTSPDEPGAFRPTHRVGPSPLDARDRPDFDHEVAARLDPGLEVAEVARWGEWVHIRCSNDWEAWVDARQLEPLGAPGVPSGMTPGGVSGLPGTSAEVPAAPVVSSAKPARPLDLYLPMGGAALVVLGSFLPWFSAGGFSVSAWDLRFVGLFTHEATDIALDTGPVLMLVLLAALPLLTRRPLPRWAVALLGGLALLCAVLALALPDPKPDPAVGLFLTLLGGVVMLGSAVAGWVSGRSANPQA